MRLNANNGYKKFAVWFFLFCSILFCSFPVKALTEGTAIPETVSDLKEIELIFPESLMNYSVQLKDEYGMQIDKQNLDKKERISLKIPIMRKRVSLFFSLEKEPKSKKTGVSLTVWTYLGILTVLVVYGVLSFALGRYSNRKILKALREYVYDETLD